MRGRGGSDVAARVRLVHPGKSEDPRGQTERTETGKARAWETGRAPWDRPGSPVGVSGQRNNGMEMKCESQPQERLLERYRRNTGRGAPKETVLGNRKAEADAEPAEGCHCPAARPVLFASPSHRRRNKVTGNHPAKGLSGGSQAWTRAA